MNRPFLLLTVLLLFCTISRAGIINVPGDQPTIQAGIDSAATGDTVLVADNTYLENINFKGKAITVASHFIMNGDTNHILNTVIDGSQPTNPDSGSVVYFVSAEDTTSILTGFTITGGSGTPLIPPVLYGEEKGGGGIYCWNAGPRITDNRITGNTLSNTDMALGGGLFCFAENNLYHLIVRNNVFSANTVDADSLAGGAGLAIGIDATVENNRVTDNTAISSTVSLGSAIVAANPFAGWGALNFNNNTITHNQATADGITYAAVYSELSDISVIENTIAYNTVSALADCWGAGVFAGFAEGNSIIQNNMISNNTSLSGYCQGGGLITYLTFALRVQENHIKHNSATYGGGIATYYSSPVIQGNVIARNDAQIGGGLWLNWFPFGATLRSDEIEKVMEGPGKLPFLRRRIDRMLKTNRSLSPLVAVKPQLLNNTIVDNHAADRGGGLHSMLGVSEVMNSILWGNTAAADSQAAGLTSINYSNVEGGYFGLGNIVLDPQFADTSDFYLTASVSPCIDAGNPDVSYNDIEDPNNPGSPLWPALGSLRNDVGAYGGDPSVTPTNDLILGPQFRAFVERVQSVPSPQRPAIVDSFMNAVPSFPFIEQDNIVYFIYRGNASSVTVPGDANSWDMNAFPMTLIGGTDLWFWQDVFEADARLDYKFVLNGSNWILDPRNPRQVSGGFGPNSELAMPAYVDPPEILNYPNIPHGTLHDTTVHSSILNNNRQVRIYTPPGYNPAGSDSFPLALFHDGLEYITLGSAKNILDYLISENRIDPIIAVFVPPVNRDDEYAFNQTAQFESFILTELMPAIDARYRTRRDPAYRAMIGLSFGGLISTQICYNHPEEFGLCGPFSPAYWPKNGEVFNMVVSGPVKNLTFYMDWGTYEPGIMLDARALRDVLLSKGYPLEWNEWHEGHSWGNWRAHLDLALEYFFPGSALLVQEDDVIPTEFQLLQNYPNPFNPTTTIRYHLPTREKVALSIYNLLGQEVITLVNKSQSAGEKSVVWDGRNHQGQLVGSGLYFYRLHAGKKVAVGKMVLVR